MAHLISINVVVPFPFCRRQNFLSAVCTRRRNTTAFVASNDKSSQFLFVHTGQLFTHRRMIEIPIGGRFQLLRNEQFWQHLAALGIPEDRAKEVDATKPILEVRVEGTEVTISTVCDESRVSSKLILDQEVDEMIALNILLKSTITLKDNQLKISSRGPGGEIGTRLFDFTDTGMTMILVAEDPNVPVAKRYYQRL